MIIILERLNALIPYFMSFSFQVLHIFFWLVVKKACEHVGKVLEKYVDQFFIFNFFMSVVTYYNLHLFHLRLLKKFIYLSTDTVLGALLFAQVICSAFLNSWLNVFHVELFPTIYFFYLLFTFSNKMHQGKIIKIS